MAKVSAHEGIRRKGNRWEVVVCVHGDRRGITFPLSTPTGTMQAWRAAQRDQVPNEHLPCGTFGRDAALYLKTVKHKPDYDNQRNYIRHWVQVFGKRRDRAAITSQMIAIELSKLLERLAPTTVRHYRTALAAVWTSNDAEAANPVLKTDRPKDRQPEARAVDLAVAQQVIAALPPCKTKIRLLLILTTGLPHKQIMQLKPEHWDRKRHLLQVTRRKKGGGTSGRLMPLSGAAEAALQLFHERDCYGTFSAPAMYSMVERACKRVGVPMFRPYDLRHTQGTMLYGVSGDLSATARLLGHTDTKTTLRYTQAAWAGVDATAVAAVGAKLEEALGDLLKRA